MDVHKILKSVKNLNDYISLTENYCSNSKNVKFQLNMSTVITLKKIRNLEVEYFTTRNESGAVFIIMDQMLGLPPSKTWGLLGKELVLLFQYWLEAVRKKFVKHSKNWWLFLNYLLKFIKTLRQKDQGLPDIIVEGTAEILLDLATSVYPDVLQRQTILACLNICCAESSRELRFALRHHFDAYFVKLSLVLATCGHLPTQYSILETLLRWLLPRQNMSVRQSAATKWFPEHVYQKKTVDLFMQRSWQNFFQDARDFLNSHNEASDRVVSVVFRKLTLGDVIVTSGDNKRNAWLDVNSDSKSISILMDVRMMEAFGLSEQTTCETLLVPDDKVQSLALHRESTELTISIKMLASPTIFPSGMEINDCDVRIVISTNCDLIKLNKILQSAFTEKYQTLLDLTTLEPTSPRDNPDNSDVRNSFDEDTRLSRPVQVARRKHSGYIVRPRPPVVWKSPSTASTTSLLQLRDKLSDLPKYRYEKEPVKVSALPDLSSVSEITEIDDRESFQSTSTYKKRSYGVCHMNFRKIENNSQSDGERYNSRKYLSPVIDEEHSNSCLLVATVGSDECVINETLDRLSRSKDYKTDNIVDLLVQEALQINDDIVQDSGINSYDNRRTQEHIAHVSEAIENTPDIRKNTPLTLENKNQNELINDTNEIQETPLNYVSIRKKKTKNEDNITKANADIVIDNEKRVFDEEIVEQYFAQHLQDRDGDIVVSPSLARKINETSSEFSDDPLENIVTVNDVYPIIDTMDDIEIIDCLNYVVDKVCNDLDKCAEIYDRDNTGVDLLSTMNDKNDFQENAPLREISNVEKENRETPKKKGSKRKASIKLTFNTRKDKIKKIRPKNQKNKLEISGIQRMSTIPEVRDITVDEEFQEPTNNTIIDNKTLSPVKVNDFDTPMIRRKRKLYSPKEEDVETEKQRNQVVQPIIHISKSENKNNSVSEVRSYNKNSEFTSACYKEIEKERKKNIRRTSLRKSRFKKSRTPSPKTKKNNEMFDKLKEDVTNKDVILADKKSVDQDLAIYNLSSDSEDEVFTKKKIEIKKRISSTTIGSDCSVKQGRLKTKVNYCENKSSDEVNSNKEVHSKTQPKKKVVRRKKAKSRKPINLADERMREATTEILETSFIQEKHIKVNKEPDLVLEVAHRMEIITDDEIEPSINVKKTKKPDTSLKKSAKTTKRLADTSDDRTSSPLPGLLVETVATHNNDADDSISTQMIERFKKKIDEAPECVYETNTTQNLLDPENINYSPQDLSITNDLNRINYPEFDVSKIDKVVNETVSANKDNEKLPHENSRKSERLKSNHVTTKKDLTNSKIKARKPVKSTIESIQDIIEIDSSIKSPKVTSKVISTDSIRSIDRLTSNAKSEKSITTVGNCPITGHGDSDEAPPNSEELTQKIVFRNLEVEGLDQSMKDYYLKLRNEMYETVNNGLRNSCHSEKTVNLNNYDAKSDSSQISPVVSIKRLSYDDISKWLPSRRNSSESNVSTTKAPSNDVKSMSKQKESRLMRSSINSSSTNSRPKQLDKRSKIPVKTRTSKEKCDDTANMSFDTSLSPIEPKKSKNITQNKSIISPIKLFEECIPNKQKSPKYDRMKIASFDLRNIINSPEIRKPMDDLEKLSARSIRYNLRKCTAVIENTKLPTVITTRASKMSTPKIESAPSKAETVIRSTASQLKRKPDSSVSDCSKKRRMETVSLSQSPTVSSVDEWLRKNALASTAESISLSCRDTVQHVMEKLDTTLAEIHQNTSKKFVHMFVDAQKKLSELKVERLQLYKQTTSDLLAEMVRVMDAKFADLEKRSQEMDAVFMNQLKQKTTQLIREDCKQKRAMVVLLREDLQALMDQMKK